MEIKINGSIVFQNVEYSTNQLNDMVSDIITQLGRIDIGEDELIALSMERTPFLLTTMFALLSLRIPFLPIDLSLPSERVKTMLANAEVSKILVDEAKYGLIAPNNFVHPIVISKNGVTKGQDYYGDKDDKETLEGKGQSELAYVLYTSGSTGTPKGVEVLRSGLENFLQSVPNIVKFPESTRIACFTRNTFDIFFLETVLALVEGFVVVLASESERSDAKRMLELIQTQAVNVIQMTPSAIQMIALVDPKLIGFSDLEVILVGGEDWKGSVFSLLKEHTHASLYNMYGPTETTIWSSIANVTKATQLSIGEPIAQTRLYLLNEQLQPVHDGMNGEICIAGAGLARGYRRNPELTEQSFRYLTDGERVYCTGDIGKRREDGFIEYIGRKDEQIKLRGHRIELGEIEESLISLDGVDAAIVCYHALDKGGELIGFYQSSTLQSQEDLLNQLKEKLPQYMIPRKLIHTDRFAYTHSLKIDRKQLLADYLEHSDSAIQEVNQQTALMSITEKLIEIIANVLEESKSAFSEEVPLEEYAIDSLSYVNMIVQIEEEFKISLGDAALSQESFTSIKDLRILVENQMKAMEEA